MSKGIAGDGEDHGFSTRKKEKRVIMALRLKNGL